MPEPTPFHPRTSALCTSLRWKEWAGYHAVCSFDTCHEREYYAFRHSAGMIDVSPLQKYDVTGPDAGAFLSYMMVRNIQRMRVGRVLYCCWCDDDGKVIDDGTVFRFDEGHFRFTSALPMYSWFCRHTLGFDVEIKDVSHELATLSLQGPTSHAVLEAACDSSDCPIEDLAFFGFTNARIDGQDVLISRTGYTGDLGYEVWVPNAGALALWDALMEAGAPHGIVPCGLDAMDITRVEAGFVLNGIDYFSAPHCLTDARKSSPFEIGLGWAVKQDRGPFMGQRALAAEKQRGSAWTLVGLVLDWDEYEALFREHGLPPHVPGGAWRTGVPVYSRQMQQVGQATSGAWSPLLKQNLALATVYTPYAQAGQRLRIEVTVEYERRSVSAEIVTLPFFDPPRKKSSPREVHRR